MSSVVFPPPPITKSLARRVTASRLRRDHRSRAARITEVFCPACRRWRALHCFARNKPLCRVCAHHS